MKYKVGDKFIIEILEDRDTCWAVTDYCTIAKTRFDRFQPYEEPTPAILMKKDDILFVKECLDALETNAYDQGFENADYPYQEKIDDLKAKILSMLEEPAPVVWRDEELELIRGFIYELETACIFSDPSVKLNTSKVKRIIKILNEILNSLPSAPEPVIEPCPFCGHAMLERETQEFHFLRCAKCGMQSPLQRTPEDAREKWNEVARKVKHE